MITVNFDMRDDVADIITLVKFCDKRFRGFGALIPPIDGSCALPGDGLAEAGGATARRTKL